MIGTMKSKYNWGLLWSTFSGWVMSKEINVIVHKYGPLKDADEKKWVASNSRFFMGLEISTYFAFMAKQFTRAKKKNSP